MLLAISPALVTVVEAQNAAGLEEIVVTARKRDERLIDIPVSITAITNDLIIEAGIEDMFDLYENTLGISWGQAQDRQGSEPSRRGVSSDGQAAVLQKMSSFFDGMPTAGQQGGIQFVGMERVEILRGPQSSAFGRSTFSGAVNYVSRNPGDEFGANIKVATSDLGRNEFTVLLDGPISDTVGFTIDASYREFDGPDEWVSNEGSQLGGTETKYIAGKLTFAPTDRFDGEIRVMYTDINDDVPVDYFLTREARDACNNVAGPPGGYLQGEFNCDSAIPAGGIPRNLNPQDAFPPGSPQFLAAQSTAVLEPQSHLERTRIQGQLNFNMDNGSTAQVLAFHSEDELQRWWDSDATDAGAIVLFRPPFAPGPPQIARVSNLTNPGSVDENYLEARWLSPNEGRLRWLVGASYYDWENDGQLWSQYAGRILGLEDEGNAGFPYSPASFNRTKATSTGIFGSVTYDLSDSTTLSVEARIQEDDVTNEDFRTDLGFSNSTTSFQPRIGINHVLSDNLNLYGQVARGTNPAGSNVGFLEAGRIRSLQAASAAGVISFDNTTFVNYDEEEITNFEVGIKGSVMDNRLGFAVSLYYMDWKDMIQPFTLQWDGAWNNGSFSGGEIFGRNDTRARTTANVGDGELYGLEAEGTWQINDSWDIRGVLTIASATFSDFCDPSVINTYAVRHTPRRRMAWSRTA